jgi:orotate phosphoribosyltransferase
MTMGIEMDDDIELVLDRCGAILRDGHFVYTSGRHGSAYVNKDAIYTHPGEVSFLCRAIALEFRGRSVEVVASPAIGGVVLAQWTAYQLWPEALAIYAERDDAGGFRLRRGYDRVAAGRRVLVVDDVLTTGRSLRGVVGAVAAAGGTIVGAACLVNRGGVTAEDVGSTAGLVSLAAIDLESYAAEDCPLCRAGRPIDAHVGKK